MANAPNPTGTDGDVRSIFSSNTLEDKLSVDNKVYTQPVASGELVTVTVDGFGAINYGGSKNLPCEESFGEEEQQRIGEGDQLEEQSVDIGPTDNMVIIQRYTFTNRNQMTVQVITYGATITSMKVPDKYGFSEDIIMGFDTLSGYVQSTTTQIGGTIGRCCNIISEGKFMLDDKTHNLTINDKKRMRHVNGGSVGFDKCVWTPHLNKTVLTLTHVSENGTEGYPGSVMARVTFELKNDNSFYVSYAATTSQPTPVNISNQLDFNLAGHGAGHSELYKHIVTLNADRTVGVDLDRIPTGSIHCVGGTVNDFRVPHELGPAIARCPFGGFDEYMCLIQGTEQSLTFVGRVVHPQSGRVLEVYTDQPGFQFYTANRFPDPFDCINPTEVYTQDYYEIPSANVGRMSGATNSLMVGQRKPSILTLKYGDSRSMLEGITDFPGEEYDYEDEYNEGESDMGSTADEPIIGKNGASYTRHGAFNFTTQQYPNAVNMPQFPSVFLCPGQMYKHEIVYKFGLFMGNTVRRTIVEDNLGEEETVAEEE